MPITHPTAGPGVDGPAWEQAHTVPTLAEVLVAGNDPGGTFVAAAADVAGASGGALRLFPASGSGGNAVLLGGNGLSASEPGGYGLVGAGDIDFNGAFVSAYGGDTTGEGGNLQLRPGTALSGSGMHGGDVVVTPGAGDGAGRNGLVFLNLPNADPAVAGSLWSDNGRVTDGASGTPTLAEVLVAGNDPGGTGVQAIVAASGAAGGGGAISITPGDGSRGGSVSFNGGNGIGANPGGTAALVAGTGNGQNGAEIDLESGATGQPGRALIYSDDTFGDVGQGLVSDGTYALWTALLSSGSGAPGSSFTTLLYLDTSGKHAYAWNGSGYTLISDYA